MHVAPERLGNADVELGPVGGMPFPPPMGQAVEVYPNPLPRKCVWAMLLLSCLLVLRVQQDRYSEVVRWKGGGGEPDTGLPFPWEMRDFVNQNDTFEACFLAPAIRRASTFSRASPASFGRGSPVVISGLSQPVLTRGSGYAPQSDAGLPVGFSAISNFAVTPSGLAGKMRRDIIANVCGGGHNASSLAAQSFFSSSSPCLLGTTHVDMSGQSWLPDRYFCHGLVGGPSLQSLRPIDRKRSSAEFLCIGSRRIYSIVPSSTADALFVTWDPQSRTGDQHQSLGVTGFLSQLVNPSQATGPPSCVARVQLPLVPQAKVPVVKILGAATILHDAATESVIAVGFSAAQTLVIQQLDAATLVLRWKYRLPIAVAWLLRAPRMSNGYLLFVGAEEPFIGTVFTVDLRAAEVYEQDPPAVTGRRRPRRRRLPRTIVAERASSLRGSAEVDVSGCGAIVSPAVQWPGN